MGSTVIYRDDGTFDDGSRYEMIATGVPKSDEYPDGVKYRFQYMAEDGRTPPPVRQLSGPPTG